MVLRVGEHEAVVAVLRHHDQVAVLDDDAHPAVVARANVEDALAFEHEAHLVVVVIVLVDELGADGVEVRRRGRERDHVLLDVAALALERRRAAAR